MSGLNIDYSSLLFKHVTQNINSFCLNQYSVSNILKAAAKAKVMRRSLGPSLYQSKYYFILSKLILLAHCRKTKQTVAINYLFI